MGHVLLYALGVVLFIIGVALSIGLHEFGHLIPGKLFNVKITQYFVGFGRTIWSKQRGETEYGLKAIPLGGYVKLVGMLPPAEGADADEVTARPTGMLAQLVSDAKRAEYEHVGPEDHDRLFYKLPVWKRIVIMGCGVATNLVLAFIFFAIAMMGYGVYKPSTTLGTVEQCLKVVKGQEDPGACTKADIKDHPTPAAQAGLRPGDQIVAFNGHKITNYSQLQELVRAYPRGAGSTTITYLRNGKEYSPAITPTSQPLPSLDDPSKTITANFIGVVPAETRQTQSLGYVFSQMADGTKSIASNLAHLPQRVYSVGKAALGFEKRDPNSIMSVVGAGRV
ncbi:MAG TPA: site-2 protease family protein, partial [Marmoricola sp.]|nr:site-2 protease family protein [Marmoricola sp.]